MRHVAEYSTAKTEEYLREWSSLILKTARVSKIFER